MQKQFIEKYLVFRKTLKNEKPDQKQDHLNKNFEIEILADLIPKSCYENVTKNQLRAIPGN